MKNELRQAIIDIATMEEFREAAELMQRKRDELVMKATMSFSKGDKVSFESRKTGETVQGVVVKINTTSIGIDGGARGKWNVSPALLKKVS